MYYKKAHGKPVGFLTFWKGRGQNKRGTDPR